MHFAINTVRHDAWYRMMTLRELARSEYQHRSMCLTGRCKHTAARQKAVQIRCQVPRGIFNHPLGSCYAEMVLLFPARSITIHNSSIHHIQGAMGSEALGEAKDLFERGDRVRALRLYEQALKQVQHLLK